jgi:transposase
MMLQLTPQSRVFLAREPADFRRGIDGLAALCRQRLGEDPMGGAIFVFRNRRGTSLKLLCYDGQGFWLCQKRFHRVGWPGGRRRRTSAIGSRRASCRSYCGTATPRRPGWPRTGGGWLSGGGFSDDARLWR